MSSDYRSETRGFLLITCFILVVPLILFPKDFGMTLNLSAFLLLPLELAWYTIAFFVMFPRESASRIFPFAVVTLGYRIGLGIGFGMLLLVMFSVPLGSAVRQGIHQYAPALLLQAIMCPFVLKPPIQVFLRNRGTSARLKVVGFEQQTGGLPPSAPAEIAESRAESKRSVFGEKESKMAAKPGFDGILHYLREYAGVRAALLVDPEGLVVACDSSPDLDAERMASYSRHLKESNDAVLRVMGEGISEKIAIYTQDIWICFHQIEEFTLVVLSERRTDELLSVRITQSITMIEKFLAEKYRLNAAKAVEA